MYQFLLNMFVMRKINEAYLQDKVNRGFITQEEMNMIIATPQI